MNLNGLLSLSSTHLPLPREKQAAFCRAAPPDPPEVLEKAVFPQPVNIAIAGDDID
jgi:hypothetical protein